MSRAYTTRRIGIVNAIVGKLKDINGSGAFLSDLDENVSPRLSFGMRWRNFLQFT